MYAIKMYVCYQNVCYQNILNYSKSARIEISCVINEIGDLVEQIRINLRQQPHQQIQCQLFPFHDLLALNGDIVHLPVLIQALDHKVVIVAGEVVLVQVVALPVLDGHDFLFLVADVEDGTVDGLPPLFEGDGLYDKGRPEVHLMNVQLMLVYVLELEVCLAKGAIFDIYNVVIVNDTVFFVGLGPAAMGDEAELVFSHLPHRRSVDFHIRSLLLIPYP